MDPLTNMLKGTLVNENFQKEKEQLLQYTVSNYISQELKKGRKMRAIKREIERKTNIKLNKKK